MVHLKPYFRGTAGLGPGAGDLDHPDAEYCPRQTCAMMVVTTMFDYPPQTRRWACSTRAGWFPALGTGKASPLLGSLPQAEPAIWAACRVGAAPPRPATGRGAPAAHPQNAWGRPCRRLVDCLRLALRRDQAAPSTLRPDPPAPRLRRRHPISGRRAGACWSIYLLTSWYR